MQPYSIDFRQKIIEIHEQENISIRKLAERFQVAKSFIQKLLKQYRETGELNPQKPGGSPPRKLQSEQLITLIEIIESNNDATLEELCELLEKKIKVRVSRATMGRITNQLNYSVKKNSTRVPSKKAIGFASARSAIAYKKRELNFGRKYEIYLLRT